MTAWIEVQAEMWEYMVVPGKFIKAIPTEKNRYSFDRMRIYADIHSFGRDFGDYDEFETIKKMWEGDQE